MWSPPLIARLDDLPSPFFSFLFLFLPDIRARINIAGFLIKGVQASPPLSEVVYLVHMQHLGNMMTTFENYEAAKLSQVIPNLAAFLRARVTAAAAVTATPAAPPPSPTSAGRSLLQGLARTASLTPPVALAPTPSSSSSSPQTPTLTHPQLETIGKLRVRLQDTLPSLPAFRASDQELARWLGARKFNLDAAEVMFRRSMKWRQDNHIDHLVDDYRPPQAIRLYWPGGAHRCARDGSLVYIDLFGQADFVGLAKATSRSEIIRHAVYLCERLTRASPAPRMASLATSLAASAMVPSAPDEGGDGTVTLVENLAGLSSRQMSSLSLALCQEILATLHNNYPERLRRVLVGNTPYRHVMSVRWTAGRLSPDSNASRKVEFVADDRWRQRLLECVEEQNLPAALGGTCCEPDDQCSAVIGKGGQVPPELYKVNDPGLETAEVAARSTFDVRMKAEQHRVGRRLRWEFATASHEVAFGVQFVPGKDKRVPAAGAVASSGVGDDRRASERKGTGARVVVERALLPGHLEAFAGEVECTGPGEFVFEWDNTHSWFQKNTLKYKVAWVS